MVLLGPWDYRGGDMLYLFFLLLTLCPDIALGLVANSDEWARWLLKLTRANKLPEAGYSRPGQREGTASAALEWNWRQLSLREELV